METKNEPDFTNEPGFAPVYRGGTAGATIQILRLLDRAFQAQRGHLLPWIPVCLGAGIGVFFLLPSDPGLLLWSLLGLSSLLVLPLTGFADSRALVAWSIILTCLGFSAAGLRSAWVAAPVLEFRYYGPVEGRLIGYDRAGNGAIRMTLDQVRLRRVSPKKRPARVRLSLVPTYTGDLPEIGTRVATTAHLTGDLPEIGTRVATTAHLMPPQGPSEPGGFDFRRYAWFHQIGANGYTRVPVVVVQPAGSGLFLNRFREVLSKQVQQRLGPRTGGVAAAIIAGDRSGVDVAHLSALRASNLAHLLAISGLHMGLLTGFVFATLRVMLCLVPALALRWNIKKISACGALVVGFLYLCISGGNVATERAYIMVLVLFGAVLLDRRALTLRAVAVAACLVLLRRPDTLLSPGFQMSFAATTALVAVFGWIRNRTPSLGPVWLRPVFGVLISSAVAGAATAPFGAAHFHVLSHYGLLANLLAVPVMGLVVVPAAVLSLLLATIGAEHIGMFFLDLGLEWILLVATSVAALPQAQSAVVMPGPLVLPILVLGALIVLLWQGRLRWIGLFLVGLAFLDWARTERPLLLVSSTGGLVGVQLAEGRALSRHNSQAYTAANWLAADGTLDGQPEAAGRWQDLSQRGDIRVFDWRVLHVTGKRQAETLITCEADQLVISNGDLQPKGECLIYGAEHLSLTGAIAIRRDGRVITAAEVSGNRPWSRP